MNALAKKIPLELADVTMSRTCLVIANPEGFERAGAALVAMDECSQWWWGDYLLYAEKFNLRSVLDGSRSNLHTSTIWSCMEIARFYPPADRHPTLSFTHHRDVRYILGKSASLKEAKKWLKRAAEEEWTAGDLREAMRTAAREEENDPGPMRGAVSISDFVKLSRWASEIDPKKIPDAQRVELRESTRPLWDFLCDIHRAQFAPSSQS
jgi:hypothetical protein